MPHMPTRFLEILASIYGPGPYGPTILDYMLQDHMVQGH